VFTSDIKFGLEVGCQHVLLTIGNAAAAATTASAVDFKIQSRTDSGGAQATASGVFSLLALYLLSSRRSPNNQPVINAKAWTGKSKQWTHVLQGQSRTAALLSCSNHVHGTLMTMMISLLCPAELAQ
jgi:hypothetical protein